MATIGIEAYGIFNAEIPDEMLERLNKIVFALHEQEDFNNLLNEIIKYLFEHKENIEFISLVDIAMVDGIEV